MVIRAVVFDLGGVLEKEIDTGKDAKWETRLNLKPGEYRERLFSSGLLIDATYGKLSLQTALYMDALFLKAPQDRARYEELAVLMKFLKQDERCLVYLTPLVERFTEGHDAVYQRIAEVQRRLSERFFEDGDDERGERFQELAEQALRKSLAVKDSWQVRIELAEVLIDEGERLDEAEECLLEAKKQVSDPKDEAHIELHLGEIETEREQFQKALGHYQRIIELQPDAGQSWAGLGKAHQNLKYFEEAEASYKRAIELNPKNPDYYSILGLLYEEQDLSAKAIEALKEGVRANPETLELYLPLVTAHIKEGNYQQAGDWLDKLEELDPGEMLIPMYRQLIEAGKSRKTLSAPTPKKFAGSKKKGTRHRHR